jgi:CheY-like chemotaxis protein
MASILIIDDDPDVLRTLRRVVESQGHTVHEAADGVTALRFFAGQPTDLVITDIYMPGMDGIELIMRIKEAFPEARVVAMSGGGRLPMDNVLGAASMLGAEALLEKPFTVEDVASAVERALAASRPRL